jgi:hypothetical protein
MSADHPEHPGRRRGLFTAGATTLLRVAIAVLALLILGAGTGAYAYFHSAYWNRIGLAPVQPILFSHRHHAGELRIDCRNCHATVETEAFAGMPSTHTCLGCHSQLFADTAMIRPLMASAQSGVALRWTRVSRLPAHVFFNHSIHVSKGVACVTCHGEVGAMALTARAEPLTMRWCLDCHRDPAPRLTDRAHLFDAFSHQTGESKELADSYHLKTSALTDCSTCHH